MPQNLCRTKMNQSEPVWWKQGSRVVPLRISLFITTVKWWFDFMPVFICSSQLEWSESLLHSAVTQQRSQMTFLNKCVYQVKILGFKKHIRGHKTRSKLWNGAEKMQNLHRKKIFWGCLQVRRVLCPVYRKFHNVSLQKRKKCSKRICIYIYMFTQKC